jgi:RNA polymerase sigma factor (sigma-70 family)
MVTAALPRFASAPTSDSELLRQFVTSGSESAFAQLVEKYLGMVLGVAMRRTGDRRQAEEIAQSVFTALARKGRSLKAGVSLAPWIHRVTLIECAEATRRELNHRSKMNAVSQHLASQREGRDVWCDTLPLLDESIDALKPSEREVVLLRFFEKKSFRDIGAVIGKSDDAAQKQTERALQRLSELLKQRGVTVPVAVLGAGLSAQLTQTAPAALAASVAHAAISTASTWSAKLLILQTLEAMTNTKLRTAMIVAATLSVPLAAKWIENGRLREELSHARDRNVAAARGSALQLQPGNNPDPENRQRATEGRGADRAPAKRGLAPASDDPAMIALQWEHVLFMADPLQRSEELSGLLEALTAETAPLVAKAFERARETGIRFADEQRLFLRAWGRLGGADAVEYAMKEGGAQTDGAVAALGGWASASPEHAKAWLDARPESEAKEKLVYGLLDGWSTVNFAAAAAYAESRPASSARDSFRELLLQRALRAGGIAAAQNWVTGISDDEQICEYKQGAFAEVIQAMLYRDPAAAARWISELGEQPFIGAEAVSNTARKLAETSPTDALRWVFALQKGDENAARGAGTVVYDWAQRDPQAAGSWLQSNASSPLYDRLVAAYAGAVASADRGAAQEWAGTIKDAQIREQTLASLNPRLAAAQFLYKQAIDSANTDLLYIAAEPGEILETRTSDGLLGTLGTRVVRLTQGGGNGSATEISIERPNPHGSAAQWANCTSCHAR